MRVDRYIGIRDAVRAAGFGCEIDWSESVRPPETPEDFATEAIYIIFNSGMRWTVARKLFDETMPLIRNGGSASDRFGHAGKCAAMDRIWAERADLHATFTGIEGDGARLEFLGSLPWIGPITKYHLAKNFGVDCAKPDRWLVRLADIHGTDAHTLCERLSEACGDRIATVDYILWRGAERGLIPELKAASDAAPEA